MARAEPITFERITRVYRDESQKRTLTPLEPDFYEKVARYVARLERDLGAERAKDPNSKAALLLEDELRKVGQKREQIYRYRERKIGLLASARAGGAHVDAKPLARPERELLDRLVEEMSRTRTDTIGGEPPAGPAEAGRPQERPSEPARAGTTARPLSDPVLLHILEDVPEFAGTDRTYRLRKEDLVTLPAQIAKVLLERGKARIVQPGR